MITRSDIERLERTAIPVMTSLAGLAIPYTWLARIRPQPVLSQLEGLADRRWGWVWLMYCVSPRMFNIYNVSNTTEGNFLVGVALYSKQDSSLAFGDRQYRAWTVWHGSALGRRPDRLATRWWRTFEPFHDELEGSDLAVLRARTGRKVGWERPNPISREEALSLWKPHAGYGGVLWREHVTERGRDVVRCHFDSYKVGVDLTDRSGPYLRPIKVVERALTQLERPLSLAELARFISPRVSSVTANTPFVPQLEVEKVTKW